MVKLSDEVSARVIGPVNSIAPADAVLLLVISPERTMPLSPTRVILDALTVPPRVIVPDPSPAVPSVNEIISSSPVLVIFPAIVISPPPLFIENVPSTCTVPRKLTSPTVVKEEG